MLFFSNYETFASLFFSYSHILELQLTIANRRKRKKENDLKEAL